MKTAANYTAIIANHKVMDFPNKLEDIVENIKSSL